MAVGAMLGPTDALDVFGTILGTTPGIDDPERIALVSSEEPLAAGASWLRVGTGGVPDVGTLEGDVVYRLPGVCEFRIPVDGSQITVHVEPDGDSGAVRWLLVRGILPRVLQARGVPCLHASAVATPSGAICFAADSGFGKSTLAAAMVLRGSRLIGDDVVPIRFRDGVALGGPGLEDLWLHPDMADRLGLDLDGFGPGLPGQKRSWLLEERSIQRAPTPIRTVFLVRPWGRTASAAAARRGPSLAQADAFRALVEGSMWIHPDLPRTMRPALPVLARVSRVIDVRPLFVRLDGRGIEAAARLVAREAEDD